MYKNLIIIILTILFFTSHTIAQKFGGSIIFGFNASQIDGDQLAGYDKIGLNAGMGVTYHLKKNMLLNIEFLYSQRGSQSHLIPDKYIPLRKLTLNYLELPVYVSFLDWWIEDENYYKVQGFAGLSYGRLYSVKNGLGDPAFDGDNFVKNDISFLMGVKYMFNSHWGVLGRYTRSINRLYRFPGEDRLALLGYFLNFGLYYKF